jgi:hypothetical protein
MTLALNPVSRECKEKEFKITKARVKSRNKPRSLFGVKTDPNNK